MNPEFNMQTCTKPKPYSKYPFLGSQHHEIIGTLTRKDFDKDFTFGSATAAYQVEGAAAEDGKGPSIWDDWTHTHPDKILDGSNGDVAIDHYHKFKEDLLLMKTTGMEAYRFSISWPRILPGGRINAGINEKGIKFYNELIDLLVSIGIEPYVTLFHWDLPLALEKEYGGFLSKNIVKDYTEFAGLCFWEFGDRVKNWITFNEAWTYCNFGYMVGSFPPGHGLSPVEQRRSTYRSVGYKGFEGILDEVVTETAQNLLPMDPIRAYAADVHKNYFQPDCESQTQPGRSKGTPGTEPYLAAHHMILAHASAVDLYRKKFQTNQGGKIGMTNCSQFFEPFYDTDEDRAACIRALDWMLGWFVAPITTGDYPPNMRKTVKKRLPTFSAEETKLVKGSYDFLGINYYTSWYATNKPRQPGEEETYQSDQELQTKTEKDGVPIGRPTDSPWLFIVPRGIYNLLVYIKETYNPGLIYITENGVADQNNPRLTMEKAVVDPLRISYFCEHLWYLRKAIKEAHVNVKAYFIWSYADNLEWSAGYTSRFGIYYIDYKNGRYTRFPKASAMWWRNFFNMGWNKSSLKREAKEIEHEVDSKKKLKLMNY